MGSKKPQPAPVKTIRVRLQGDHAWAGSTGTIYRNGGDWDFITVGTKKMVRVHLDGGHECFASVDHLVHLPRPTSPAPPKKPNR